VNGFASQNLMLPRGPQYLFENIRDYVVIIDEGAGGKIVACGSLHVLWLDMAEIRSMAIHPDYQKRGLGRRLIEFLKQEAGHLGIRRLFTFTLSEEFFARLGFTRKLRDELPPKVWGECSRCPIVSVLWAAIRCAAKKRRAWRWPMGISIAAVCSH